MRRPLAEHCERISVSDLRPLVEPGTEHHALADGTRLQLRWAAVRGCFGGREGRALVLRCPGCQAHARVLWRPPGADWRCWRCQPISHRSHRRPGARRGRPKPVRWRVAQICAEQRKIADLLGLASWPPQRLLWDYRSLGLEARRPDAPRLSSEREWALTLRIDALENMRLALLLPQIDASLRELGQGLPEWPELERGVAGSRRVVRATAWAMRRPAQDPRTPRGSGAPCADRTKSPGESAVRILNPSPFSVANLADPNPTDSVRTTRSSGHGLHSPRRNPEAPPQLQRAGLVSCDRPRSRPDPERASSPVSRH